MQTSPSSEAVVRYCLHMHSRPLTRPQLRTTFTDEPYRELGANYFDNRRQAHLVDQLTRRIDRLGYRVTLEPVAAA